MFTLATPVVVAELGWMTMGMVDTLMVGRLGAEAIGAVGIGTRAVQCGCVFSLGMLLGLDTLVSQAFGAAPARRVSSLAGSRRRAQRSSSPIPVTLLLFALSRSLDGVGHGSRGAARSRVPISMSSSWSVPPLLLYFCFRRYLQGMGSVRPVMIALVDRQRRERGRQLDPDLRPASARPRWASRGAAWATVLSRVVMAAYLLVVIVHRERGRRPGLFETPLRIELARMRRLVVARRTRGAAADARSGRVRGGVGTCRAAAAGGARGAPDRAEPRRRSRSWCRWASRLPGRFASVTRSARATVPPPPGPAGRRSSSGRAS